MSLPIITIITVTYNAAQWLERCVESVAMQKREGFEIEHLIVDGASTDGTVALIARLFAEGKISRFVSEKDAGIYDAMNKGIALARGSIIAFLNADDEYYAGAIQSQVEPLIQGIAAYTYGNVEVVDTAGSRHCILGYTPENLFYGVPFPHPSLFCLKIVFEQLGVFDTRFRVAADADLMVRLCLSSLIGYNTECLVVRYLNTGVSTAWHQDDMALLEEQYVEQIVVRLQSAKDWLAVVVKLRYDLLESMNANEDSLFFPYIPAMLARKRVYISSLCLAAPDWARRRLVCMGDVLDDFVTITPCDASIKKLAKKIRTISKKLPFFLRIKKGIPFYAK